MVKGPATKKIWIDLDNSPHVLFFYPIIRELKKKGFEVVVTARDYAQVIGLADMFGLDYQKIGHHYGKNTLLKIFGLLVRSMLLLPVIWKDKPALALSHGSRSQQLIAKIMGIPIAMAFDYEHTKELPFICLDLALVPEVLSQKGISLSVKNIVGYPGIKEDVYVHEFVPEPEIYQTLGINKEKIVVTLRPPATAAHYHTAKGDELFQAVVEYVCKESDTVMVMLPRTKDQDVLTQETWSDYFDKGKIIIPKQVVDGVNLLWHSDLVISGGGTIIREAAALNIPAYSTFGGKIGAVDEFLEVTGRLTFLRNSQEVKTKLSLCKRVRPEKYEVGGRQTLQTIVNEIASFVNS